MELFDPKSQLTLFKNLHHQRHKRSTVTKLKTPKFAMHGIRLNGTANVIGSNTHIHTHTHTRTHAHTHARTHAHTHIHIASDIILV